MHAAIIAIQLGADLTAVPSALLVTSADEVLGVDDLLPARCHEPTLARLRRNHLNRHLLKHRGRGRHSWNERRESGDERDLLWFTGMRLRNSAQGLLVSVFDFTFSYFTIALYVGNERERTHDLGKS